MKPDWKDAPAGRDWLAMDGDGRWNWFRLKPVWSDADNFFWLLHDDDWHVPISAGVSKRGLKNAKNTLEARP